MITSIAILILAVSVSVYILVRSTIEVKTMKMVEAGLKMSENLMKKAFPELEESEEQR
jgi:hypothetical protein